MVECDGRPSSPASPVRDDGRHRRTVGPVNSMYGGGQMVAKAGDRIVIESQKVSQRAREGEILEVIEASYGTRYRVRWDDGHESTFRPAGGIARIVPARERERA
jgi:hypothetical protein